MLLINRLSIKLFAKKVGTDQYGNTYYISNRKDYLNQPKRYVIYKGMDEPSKVPPMWHAWLHYTTDTVPTKFTQKYQWQKEFTPNLSGTNGAYCPYPTVKTQKYLAWQGK